MMRLITLTGGEEIERTPFSAAALFSIVEPTLRDTALRQGANLTFTDAGASYQIDADLMASVLINLVDNACSAGAKQVAVIAAPGSLRVADDGCGIAPELVRRVTQPFFRADKARSRKQGHAGLGLALVSRIVELHNGTLEIESEVGRGTTMTIRFSD